MVMDCAPLFLLLTYEGEVKKFLHAKTEISELFSLSTRYFDILTTFYRLTMTINKIMPIQNTPGNLK
jgi:hypothetical protein